MRSHLSMSEFGMLVEEDDSVNPETCRLLQLLQTVKSTPKKSWTSPPLGGNYWSMKGHRCTWGLFIQMLPPTYAKGKPQLHELAMLVSCCLRTSLSQKELHHLLIPNTKCCKTARRQINEFPYNSSLLLCMPTVPGTKTFDRHLNCSFFHFI